jgi:hypothetical protein
MTQKPPVTPTPSPPSPPARLPTKSVEFVCRDGQWEAEVKLLDPKAYFTERDWNQLSILLNVKRAHIRRQAALALYRQQSGNK